MKRVWRGSIVAVVTPFTSNGKIDFAALGQLIDFHVENQTDGIVVCGTTGEAATLSRDEYASLIEFAIQKVGKRIPVIAGTGSNSTAVTIENSQLAQSLGVDGVLVVAPYYNKPTPRGMYEHFAQVAASVSVPIILYNVPGRTASQITVDVVLKLANDFENVVGIKEASGDLVRMAQIINCRPNDFMVFSGDDALAFAAVTMGADGVISVIANIIPREFHDLMTHASKGELQEAQQIYYRYLNLMNLCFVESNPIPVKTALHLMGVVEEQFRLPMCPMERENRNALQQELISLELL